MHKPCIFPCEWHRWDEEPRSQSTHTVLRMGSQGARQFPLQTYDSSKTDGEFGVVSKLPSERIHSYPANIAMGAHNNVIVATGNIHLVRSWRLLSFSVISKCISVHESNLAVPSVMLLLMTTDNKIHVFVDLIFDIPANDSKMHKRQRKSFHCILSVTLIYLLRRKTEKNSATTTEIGGTSTMYTIRQF